MLLQISGCLDFRAYMLYANFECTKIGTHFQRLLTTHNALPWNKYTYVELLYYGSKHKPYLSFCNTAAAAHRSQIEDWGVSRISVDAGIQPYRYKYIVPGTLHYKLVSYD